MAMATNKWVNEYFNLWWCCFDIKLTRVHIVVFSLQAVLLVGWRTVSGYTTVTHSRRKNDKVYRRKLLVVCWVSGFWDCVFHVTFYMCHSTML